MKTKRKEKEKKKEEKKRRKKGTAQIRALPLGHVQQALFIKTFQPY